VDLTKPLLLYFDFDDNNKLRVGNWGMQVTASNIAFFKFASVVGFTMTSASDSWDMSDIKFEPSTTKATSYEAIPAWDDFPSKPSSYSITTNLDYVSTTVHTFDNVKAGYGDPCQLVGYTGAEINAMSSLPTATYRLPTTRENDTFVGYTGTPTSSDIGASYVTITTGSPGTGTFPQSDPANQILPAVGGRNTDGSVNNWGAVGRYLSATPLSAANGYSLYFDSNGVYPSSSSYAERGMPVRCVAK
jgi:hypothetical protein